MRKVLNEKATYRSGVSLTMSDKGHLDNCWVSTQPIKGCRSLRPLREKVGVARMRGHFLFNLINPSPALRASSPARGEEIAARGFTLIELLVVVLIIGILVAVAMPQYQWALEKSRASSALVSLKIMSNTLELYWLANGSYPQDLDDLDIKVPDIPGWTVWYDRSYYIMFKNSRGYDISLSLPHGSWYRKKFLCNTSHTSDLNSMPEKICKHLCNTNTLSTVWGSGNIGCFFN